MTTLTSKETLALIALAECANDAAGGDFGFFDELNIPAGIGGIRGMASLYGSLMAKGLCDGEADVSVNGVSLNTCQFYLEDSGWELVESLGGPCRGGYGVNITYNKSIN